MAHELDRIIRAFGARPWAIEEVKALELAELLAMRHARGPRAAPYRGDEVPKGVSNERAGSTAILRMHGTIVPRASAVKDVSSAFVSMEAFGATFEAVASDPKVSAIVMDIDSPGGMIDLVPEVAAKIIGARSAGRPIYAVANTTAASAAYWLGSQADKVFASPSAQVGSIGVLTMHQDFSAAAARSGVKVTHIHAGPRKVEGNPFEPLSKEARADIQESVNEAYAAFVQAVAAGRSVPEDVVRADPEKASEHMGGGRVYGAQRALSLGMIDGIATLAEVVAMTGATSPSARIERERLALL